MSFFQSHVRIFGFGFLVFTIVGCTSLPGGTSPNPPTAANTPAILQSQATATQPVQPGGAPSEAPPRISPTSPPAGTPDPSTLLATAAPMCEAAFAKPVPALANLQAPDTPLLFLLNKEYEGRTWLYNPVFRSRYATDARTVRSVACIVETRIQKDKYPDGTPIYQLKWEVRVLRWPDGQILRQKEEMTGGFPPQQFPKPNVSAVYGDAPEDQLVTWIREVITQ